MQALRSLAAAVALAAVALPPAVASPRRPKSDLGEVLARMNEAAKHLKSVMADLDYTTVTVLVNDRSTESGRFFMRNPKNPEILIEFTKPDPKTILFKHNEAEIYYPNLKRVEQYDLQRQSGLVQQFLLLGFGTDAASLKENYNVRLVDEQDLQGESTALLELIPKRPEVQSQLSKIQLWVSEDSWLPAQQQFFEPSGDYLIAHYTGVKTNRPVPGSTFDIDAPNAQRVKKN
ncbi:MAG TPA: outer membrane lipoprotein carrier protein LolA [Terriglobia bacterium]|jgi:outer membrane lipoprotein-sorting protein|nr:outer membrane lipoprotein carrier protein LolA [Terriglobia bacterium]